MFSRDGRKMGLKEKQYLRLREKLDCLGYAHPLSLDSLPLVQRLLEDFESLQSRLEYFKNSALQSDSKCGALEQSVIPIKRDNENLIRDNNELHRIIIHERDKYEKIIQELRTQVEQAETAYSDLEFAYMEQLSSNGILHQDILSKNEKLLQLESSTCKDKRDENKRVKFCSVSLQNQKSKAKSVSSVSSHISKALSGLTKTEMVEEIEKLKNNNSRLKDAIEHNKHMVEARDDEIRRLGKLLEKKAPVVVQSNLSCNCHLTDNVQPEPENCESLKIQLEEAHEKLHIAIEKSASLMERLELLENKFKEEKSIQFQNECDQIQANNRISYERKSVPIASPANDRATAELTARVEVLENKIIKLERMESPRICHCEQKCEKQVSNTGSEKTNTELTERVEVLESKLLRSETSHSQRVCSSCDNQCSCFCDRHFKHREKISDSEDSELPLCSHKNVIRTLMKEKKEATEELSKIQNELLEYKERVAGLSQAKHNEKCNREVVRLQLEDKIKSSELEKKSISEKLNSVTSKLRNSEQIVEKLIHKCENLTTECANWKAKYNHIKVLNEHLEMSIKNSEDTDKNKEADIKSSVKKIQSLEDEKASLENALQALHKERANLRNNIHYLDKEKDSLLINLDEKAVHISKLESAFKQKNNYITNLEHEISNLQAQLQTMERMLTSTENKARSSNKDVRKMEAEICTLESCKENLLYENRRLQNDLSALTQDNMQMSSALEASKLEVENLKLRLQTYVEEVRRVDELLQIKENERAELLEQFKALSAEASNLEVNNQSLEYETSHVKKTLEQTNGRVQNLEWEVESKNFLVKDMEDQVTELTSQIHDLHSKISEKDQYEIAITNDLEVARTLCSTLEKQKRGLNDQIVQLQQKEKRLQTHLEQLKENNESLKIRIAEEERNKMTLEEVLASSREEAMEKSMYSRDLRTEKDEMQQKVCSLENKLDQLNKMFHDNQRLCQDYQDQIRKLQRELTNEKYERTRADDSASFSTSL